MNPLTARPFAPRTALRAAASAAALAAGALLLTACGSMSSAASSPSGATASASSSTRMQQQAAYRQCLSQHGFTPKPHVSAGTNAAPNSASPSGDPAREQAQKACAGLRPKGGHDGRKGLDGAAKKALAACLQQHGVAVPSASPGAGRGGLHGLDTADPKTAEALKACRAALPKHGSGSPSATASPSA
ncbi:hypothetical protein [Streptomyces sp. NPDC091217]|uniref:hypothetical protein n=1 Tax=Streptomyces sp. NPDC091217 TaxID=3365975 RepID=UPI0037F30D9C